MSQQAVELAPNESGVWEARITPESSGPPAPVAEMEAPRVLDGLAGMEIAGIPLGAAVIGGGVAALGTGVLDGVLQDQDEPQRMLIKGAAAWLVANQGGRIIGRDAARMAATFLVWDIVGDRVQELVSGVTDRFRGQQSPMSRGMPEPSQVPGDQLGYVTGDGLESLYAWAAGIPG